MLRFEYKGNVIGKEKNVAYRKLNQSFLGIDKAFKTLRHLLPQALLGNIFLVTTFST